VHTFWAVYDELDKLTLRQFADSHVISIIAKATFAAYLIGVAVSVSFCVTFWASYDHSNFPLYIDFQRIVESFCLV
jgi:hypothetical protein